MRGEIEVRITFDHGSEHAPSCILPFDCEAFRDALTPIDHFDKSAHPMLSVFCTSDTCKRERTVSRDILVRECTLRFSECLKQYLDSKDTLMGYAIESDDGGE